MIHNKIFAGLFCMLSFSLCSVPSKNAGTPTQEPGNTTNGGSAGNSENNNPVDNYTYSPTGNLGNSFGVWSGGTLDGQIPNKSYIKGWYIVYRWEKLEPTKNNFDWNYFDDQVKAAAGNGYRAQAGRWLARHRPRPA